MYHGNESEEERVLGSQPHQECSSSVDQSSSKLTLTPPGRAHVTSTVGHSQPNSPVRDLRCEMALSGFVEEDMSESPSSSPAPSVAAAAGDSESMVTQPSYGSGPNSPSNSQLACEMRDSSSPGNQAQTTSDSKMKTMVGSADMFIQPGFIDNAAPQDMEQGWMPEAVPLAINSFTKMVHNSTHIQAGIKSGYSTKHSTTDHVPVSLSGLTGPFSVNVTTSVADSSCRKLPKMGVALNNCRAKDLSISRDKFNLRQRRFLRTREALEKSGLMGVTMKTADLIKSNMLLGKQINSLKRETAEFIRSIVNNPQNQKLRDELLQEVMIEKKK